MSRPAVRRVKVREHGTYACYAFGLTGCEPGNGCRCVPCKDARREYERERRAQRDGPPPYVSADRARAHVEELTAAGVGIKTIAKRAGISTGALSKLIYGQSTRNRGPSKRIRKATEDKILAVMPSDTADGAYVPAGPTWEIVAELRRRGWTKAAIGREIGQSGVSLQLSRSQVTAGNARTIKTLLDAPVPPRRSKYGLHEVPQPVKLPTITADDVRRENEADRRAIYRGNERDRYDLPALAAEGDQSWMAKGSCRVRRDIPTWMFFPGSGDHRTIRSAVNVCVSCPVKERCLEWAMENNEAGVWGGTTGRERNRLRGERLKETG